MTLDRETQSHNPCNIRSILPCQSWPAVASSQARKWVSKRGSGLPIKWSSQNLTACSEQGVLEVLISREVLLVWRS